MKLHRIPGYAFLAIIGVALISASLLLTPISRGYCFLKHKIRPVPRSSHAAFSETLLTLINHYRNQRNLPALETDCVLCDYARRRAKETMLGWTHAKFRQKGPYQNMGENLARGFSDPEQILISWLGSPAHKRIIEGDYNLGCVGVHLNGEADFYVTLEMAKL